MHGEPNTSVDALSPDILGQEKEVRVMDPDEVIDVHDRHDWLQVEEVELTVGLPEGLIVFLKVAF